MITMLHTTLACSIMFKLVVAVDKCSLVARYILREICHGRLRLLVPFEGASSCCD
jgi:hypothetical protein